jgi:hypothetical protein
MGPWQTTFRLFPAAKILHAPHLENGILQEESVRPQARQEARLPKALGCSGTPVPFTAQALETKVSATMCSGEGGFSNLLLNESQCLKSSSRLRNPGCPPDC